VTDGTTRARLTLALDLAALIVFVLVGMRSHRLGTQAEIFLRTALPVGAAWLVLAAVLRTYRPTTLLRLVTTWAVAVPIGLLLRVAWVGSPRADALVVFFAVAMAFTLLFLAIGRGIAAVVALALARRNPA
jgi:hypothetical protein